MKKTLWMGSGGECDMNGREDAPQERTEYIEYQGKAGVSGLAA